MERKTGYKRGGAGRGMYVYEGVVLGGELGKASLREEGGNNGGGWGGGGGEIAEGSLTTRGGSDDCSGEEREELTAKSEKRIKVGGKSL